MAALFWVTKTLIERLSRSFPFSHGVPRVDGQRFVSGIIQVTHNGRCACRVRPTQDPVHPLNGHRVTLLRAALAIRLRKASVPMIIHGAPKA